jgi:iron(II)-dependent oxidoreductase
MQSEATTRLAEWAHDARKRTFELVADLDDEQLIGPYLPIVNPLLWEIGHVAWFQEKWVLRHVCKQRLIRDDADALWDSIAIAHETRWDLPIPSREETLAYMREVRDGVIEWLQKGEPSEELVYFVRYTVFHEDMHTEAFTYARQTLGYSLPPLSILSEGSGVEGGPLPGDVEIPGGTFLLGATKDEPFVFDNEKWAHPVEVKPFAIARAPVTQSAFAGFVDDDGYRRKELWSEEGWGWRESVDAAHPAYWKRDTDGEWLRRHFDEWASLELHLPIIHVNWYEAEAYCRWAVRRLPTEAEWEVAAAVEPTSDGQALSSQQRRFPWGNEPPTPVRANLDWRGMGCIDVGALPESDSAFGCRQMIGNVWEWTSSTFLPYPGFEMDPYKEYSEPWFETRKVLRGGCWTTRSRMLRNTWRNFYTPDRRDVLAGFRTCALD